MHEPAARQGGPVGERMMTSSPATARQTVRPARAAAATPRRGPASVRFYVCVLILVASAAGMQVAARALGHYFRKEAVPLKRSLSELDCSRLAPEYRPYVVQEPPLNEEMVQAIGTEEYLQLRLVDTRRSPSDPACTASVLVTYYTGQPDMVPHVPDECWLAGGYDQVGSPQTIHVPVQGVGAPNDEVPVRVLEFRSRQRGDTRAVAYFFHANGQYRTTRNGVRFLMANPLERYAYHAKIEVSFTDDPVNPRQAPRLAGREDVVAAIGPLLQKLLPVLLEDHFAWDETTSGEQDPTNP